MGSMRTTPATMEHEAAARELVRGRELVSRLRTLLQGGSSSRERQYQETAEAIMEDISESFTRALDSLVSPTPDEASATIGGWNPDSRERENSGIQKVRCANPLGDDGHSWKKYGQKNIIGSKFTRSYFKCSLRKDHGCPATKHVQQTDENPPMFLVTYIGQHTCTNIDGSSPADERFLSFESGFLDNGQVQKWPVSQSMSETLTDSESASDAHVSLMGTSYVVPVDMNSRPDPHVSDIDSMANLLQSMSSFYYGEDVSFDCPPFKNTLHLPRGSIDDPIYLDDDTENREVQEAIQHNDPIVRDSVDQIHENNLGRDVHDIIQHDDPIARYSADQVNEDNLDSIEAELRAVLMERKMKVNSTVSSSNQVMQMVAAIPNDAPGDDKGDDSSWSDFY